MGVDKLWAEIGGRPVIELTLEAVSASRCFDQVVIVARSERWERLRELAQRCGFPSVTTVEGGDTRQMSVYSGVALCVNASVICVHDAARPLCTPSLFRAVVDAAKADGAATLGIPCVDTIKRVDGNHHIVDTLQRSSLVAVQTPQAFDAALLRRAHEEAQHQGVEVGDECELVERLGHVVTVVDGSRDNIKVTTPHDLVIANALLERVA